MDCEKMCEIKRVRQRVEYENKRVGELTGGWRVDCEKKSKTKILRGLGH